MISKPLLVGFMLAIGAAALTTRTAAAGPDVPSPANWVTPACITVVGHDGNGVADPRGEVTIIARDLANQPEAGVLVTLDFSECSDLRLCSDPHDLDAVVDCATRQVRKFTDANGYVRFRIVGGSLAVPGSAGSGFNNARIYGDGVLKASPSVSIYDLTGSNGLGASDLSAWLDDFFGGLNPARCDYDCSGALGATDLSEWLGAFFASGSALNCTIAGSCSP